ncbi:LuxR C-terminal-related transcriptional regulator [Vibrio nigripulchritudo]|uniref:LuxR C-terminal-related transcriptional regulator n=2 Tax=Vibrio nigripulchritudo TaxID=28173 RepID=UPI0009B9C653
MLLKFKTSRLEMQNHQLSPFKGVFPELTEKQFSVLHRYAIGGTVLSIASELACSQDNVRAHLNASKNKLEVANNHELRTVYLTRVMCLVASHLCI